MTVIYTAIFWGSIQATVFSVVAMVIYLLARKFGPKVGATVALTSLLLLGSIGVLALSPWPTWDFEKYLTRANANAMASANAASANDPASDHLEAQTAAESLLLSDEAKTGNKNAAAKGPISSAIFWQTFGGYLKSTSAPPTQSAWGAGAWLVALFAMGMLSAITCRIVGLVSVWRHVDRSKEITDTAICDLRDLLQSQMSIPGRIDLRESSDLTTAAAVGIRNPVVLLPESHRDWTHEEREVVLAHELAHIARRDYLTWILAQLGVLLHFYHPLAHWFGKRLRLEQELAADALAARTIGDRESYLNTLGNLALRSPSDSLAWPVQAFLPVRSTFLRRIEMLREPKSTSESRWASTGGPLSLASLGLIAVLVCGLRMSPDGEAVAQGTAGRSGKQIEIDEQLLPPGLELLLQVQPKDLLASPELREMNDLLEDLATDMASNLKLSDMECGWQIVADTTRQQIAVFVVRLKKPSPLFEQHGRKVLLAEGDRTMPVLLWDDRTIVIGNGLENYLAQIQRERVPPTWLARYRKLPNRHVRGFVNMEAISRSVPDAAFQGPMSMYSPAIRLTRDVMFTLDLEGKTKVAARFATPNEESAEKVRRTVAALVDLARNVLDQQMPMIEQGPNPMFKSLKGAMDLADTLLASTDVKAKGHNVDFKAVADGDGVVAMVALLPAVQAARLAARRTQSINNLRQISLALLNYESANGRFPAASMKVVLSAQTGQWEPTKHPYSWRVAILPYMEHTELYEQYRFDEPWDSPANKKLIASIPPTYSCPGKPLTGFASYFAPISKHTILGSSETGTEMRMIEDGTSRTIIVMEANRDIPWTKPEDIPATVKPDELGASHEELGFCATRADGSTVFYSNQIDADTLHAWFNMHDGINTPRIP